MLALSLFLGLSSVLLCVGTDVGFAGRFSLQDYGADFDLGGVLGEAG